MTIYSHRFTGTLPEGDVFSTGWHSASTAGLSGANANAVTWLNDFWGGLLGVGALYNTGVVFTRVTTYELNIIAPFHTFAIAETEVSLAGTSATASLPQLVSPVISFRSADPTRHGRGRMYLPAPDSAQLTNQGGIPASFQGAVLGGLQTAWAAVNPLGEHPVIFNKVSGFGTPITRFGLGSVYDRQGRRVNEVPQVRVFDAMP